MGYTPEQKELLDAIQIMIDNTLNSQVTKIYSCIMYDIGNNKQCTILLNGQTHAVQYYGDEPTVGQQYKVFVPFNNMAQAFVITGGSAGSDPSTTNNYSQLTNKPSINSVTLSGNSTSTDLGLYGSGNEPNYPVTKVNNKTGEVSLTATDLNAVPTSRTINGKALSTNISLTSSDVGALPSSTVIPTQTSQLTNNSGFITSVQAPVQSVNGGTGEVVLSASDVGALSESTTYVESVNGSSGLVTIDKTAVGLGNLDNVRQYSASNPPPYPVSSVNGQTGAVNLTIPTETSDLINDSGFITASGAPVQSVNGQTGTVSLSIPTKTSDLTNDNGFITSAQSPVQSVNGKSGTVVLTQDDVGNGTTYVQTQNNYTTTEKTKLSGIATGAQVNVIEFVKRNGVTLNATGKAVDIVVPTKTSEVTNDSGFITSAGAPVQSVSGRTGAVILSKIDVGLGNVDNIQQYSVSNPPPYPVTSVNGQTGPVSLSIPTKTSDLTNDSKFLPVTQTSPTNGQIVAYDGTKWVNQNPASYSQQQADWEETDSGSVQFIQNKPTALSEFSNDSGFITSSGAPVQSVNGTTGIVNITSVTGNAGTATKLATSKTIAISGGATGTATAFDGSTNITIPVTSLDATKLTGTATISTTGNAATATSATKATQDGNGSTISTTYAKLASPTLTGTPKAPTATAGTKTTQIATTAFVTTAVTNAGGNVTYLSATAPTSPKTGDTWYQIL